MADGEDPGEIVAVGVGGVCDAVLEKAAGGVGDTEGGGGTHAFSTAAPGLPFNPTVAAFAGALPGAPTITSAGSAKEEPPPPPAWKLNDPHAPPPPP